ncbi:putative transposase [Carbonactinospora thermoautotrophica]|nr:putative transposase [Carbonactinospora thermoautotrophica]KWX01256.1 putative transposase [Carbonactinospora thermoautotrophica]
MSSSPTPPVTATPSSTGSCTCRELYLPESWTVDRDRCRDAGIPEEIEFATKPRLAMAILARAVDAKIPFAWVTADETYGQVKYPRVWLEEHDLAYVLATRRNNDVLAPGHGFGRADELVAALPARAWRRLSCADGAHGPRRYDWARVPIRIAWRPGRGHWLLARRSIADPTEIAYYVCSGPRHATLTELARVAGTRWATEECFHQAKTDAGLDHDQARHYRAWYAHITLSMLAHAWLTVARANAAKGARIPATVS